VSRLKSSNRIKIIGGKWRSRTISFPDNSALRPTPSRIRETLFNWLTPYIVNARCLDLFAGSGVLGFEALSRGARACVLVENDRKTIVTLRETVRLLDTNSVEIVETEGLLWLKQPATPFDVVFLDPPYHAKLLPDCFALLEESGWLEAESLIYFESNKPIAPAILPITWQLWHKKKAGQVYYYLAKRAKT
jgi:16S rRNA (guanine966-N2)-methyltransferase